MKSVRLPLWNAMSFSVSGVVRCSVTFTDVEPADGADALEAEVRGRRRDRQLADGRVRLVRPASAAGRDREARRYPRPAINASGDQRARIP